jgi:hypothetical protein
VLTSVFSIIVAVGMLAALYYLAAAGFRNGDRPGDALVTTVPLAGPVPSGRTAPATAAVLVRNPTGTPVLVGLTARAAFLPAWLALPHDVSVPRWTLRGKFTPERYECVGVVLAAGATEFAVPALARARRTVLTVAVGQEGGRLRVHRLRLGLAGQPAEGGNKLVSLP